jgi:hypothetical protein
MKSNKLKVIVAFHNKEIGQIINPLRLDISNDLVNRGYCEWVTVETKEEEIFPTPIIAAPIILEPKTEQNDNSDNKRGEESITGEGSVGVTKQRRGRKSGKSKA